MRILLIEENLDLANLIDTCLGKFYVLDEVSGFKKARYFLDTKNYDLLIADINSPDEKDLKLCHYLKEYHIFLPVLFLTAELTIQQKVSCLQRGADYLIKPFSISELSAKAKNLLRKGYKNRTKKLAKINLEIDQIFHKVYVGEKEVSLNRKEYALLELFLYHPKQVMSKAMLAERIWQGDQVLTGNAIETTISHLRKKIGKDFIKTIKGVGYSIKND